MSARHRVSAAGRRRSTGLFVGGALAAVLVSLVIVAIVSVARQGSAPAGAGSEAAQPLRQDGRIVAVSDTFVTAVGADGVSRTFLLTPETTSVTEQGGRAGSATSVLGVDEQVSIVGELRNGTAVATAVASRAVSDGNGPPMDFALP